MKNKYSNIEQVKYLPENIKEAAENTEHIIKDPNEISVITDGIFVLYTSGLHNIALVSSSDTVNTNKQPTEYKTGKALPLAALAILIIGLLPSVIEAAVSVIEGIKKIISGEEYSKAELELLASEAAEPRTGEALPLAALAPIIISLLPTIIKKVPEALGGIQRSLNKKIISGAGVPLSPESGLDIEDSVGSTAGTTSNMSKTRLRCIASKKKFLKLWTF